MLRVPGFCLDNGVISVLYVKHSKIMNNMLAFDFKTHIITHKAEWS